MLKTDDSHSAKEEPLIKPWRGDVPEPCHAHFMAASAEKITWPEKAQEKVKSKPVKPKMEQKERRVEKSSSAKDGKLIGSDEDQRRREQEAARMVKRMFS